MDYKVPTNNGDNYTISMQGEALSVPSVKGGAWGVHARLPGAFFVPNDEAADAGMTEEWLYDDEPVAIPDEIKVVRDDEGNALHTEVTKWREGKASEVSLPSLATQWKNDMRQRVAIARKHDPNAYPVLRMPESFIKTGILPTK